MTKPATKKSLIEALGADEVRARLDLGPRAVAEALRRDELLPAWWFVDCEEIGKAKGVTVSRSLFNFGARKPRWKTEARA